MTTGICDMHCHILPKLDDGSKSMDETIQAIEEGVRQGIRMMIATPHFYPGRDSRHLPALHDAPDGPRTAGLPGHLALLREVTP